MSGRVITRYEMTCDGCGKTLGENGEYVNSTEARACAYGLGWRFPSKVRMNGTASAKYISDVCPDCLPTFEAQPGPNNWKSKRGEGVG